MTDAGDASACGLGMTDTGACGFGTTDVTGAVSMSYSPRGRMISTDALAAVSRPFITSSGVKPETF